MGGARRLPSSLFDKKILRTSSSRHDESFDDSECEWSLKTTFRERKRGIQEMNGWTHFSRYTRKSTCKPFFLLFSLQVKSVVVGVLKSLSLSLPIAWVRQKKARSNCGKLGGGGKKFGLVGVRLSFVSCDSCCFFVRSLLADH